MKAPYAAADLAEYLLWRTSQERPEDPDYLTPMKLQKLLYYVQGWALAQTGCPLFADPIEAWREGPVVQVVYARYKKFGKGPITDIPDTAPEVDAATRDLIEHVWDRYKHYSAFGLSAMTHEERPWLHARRGKPEEAPGRDTIPLDEIRREFSGKMPRAQERWARHAGAIVEAARENTRRSAPWLATPAPDSGTE